MLARIQARALQEMGMDVAFLVTSDQPGLHRENVDGVTVWRAGIRNLFWRFKDVKHPWIVRKLWHLLDLYNFMMKPYVDRVLDQERPDIVVCHNLMGWSISAWGSCFKRGLPVVQILHDQYLLCPASSMFRRGGICRKQCRTCRLMRIPHKRMSSGLAAVVGVSGFVLNRFLEYGYFRGVPHFRVIHNACDGKTSSRFPLSTDRRNDEKTRFGFMGRLAYPKGIDELLSAFSQSPIPGTELIIAGDLSSPYSVCLQETYGDVSEILFAGRMSPADFYSQVDVLVVPSLWEDTFPTVILEAMQYGVPVIGSNRGGIPEMIRDGETGIIVEAGDRTQLVHALQAMADSPDTRNRMGRRALELSREGSVVGMVNAYRDLYQQVLESWDSQEGEI